MPFVKPRLRARTNSGRLPRCGRPRHSCWSRGWDRRRRRRLDGVPDAIADREYVGEPMADQDDRDPRPLEFANEVENMLDFATARPRSFVHDDELFGIEGEPRGRSRTALLRRGSADDVMDQGDARARPLSYTSARAPAASSIASPRLTFNPKLVIMDEPDRGPGRARSSSMFSTSFANSSGRGSRIILISHRLTRTYSRSAIASWHSVRRRLSRTIPSSRPA